MLNKENYVPWLSRLLQYAKSRPNGKLLHNSIINGPYVRRMIPEPCDPNREVPVNETFHVQTDDEISEKELKQIETGDQAIQTILLSLPEDIYAAVDSCEIAQEFWLHVQQMMKGSDIGIQEKKTKLFNECERINTFQKRLPAISSFKQLATRMESTCYHCSPNKRLAYNILHSINYMQQPMPNIKDITDPTTAINMALALMAKAFKLNYSTPTNNNQRISSNPRNRQIAQPGMNMGQDRQMQMVGVQKPNGNGNLLAARAEGNATGHNADLDKIEEVNENCILMENLQQASTSGTQTDKAPVYDSDGSAEVHNYEDFYDNEVFNMFTQEDLYTELVEPIPEPHQVPQNDNNVISEVCSVKQSGGIVEQHPANVEEIRVLYDSLYNNLAIEVEKVNTVNRKLSETNAELTTKLARYKNQENCFEISQEKYDKLKRCYQKSVYQEQCLSKKINDLHLISEAAKFIGDFKYLAKEADESLGKHKALELEIKRLLRAIVSQDIMTVVQNNSVVDTSNLQTELERTKERFENCIIKKENEYAKLWNDWYKKFEECKFDKISYDKTYHDMQQKIERLQAQLGDLKGESKNTSCVSDTLNPLSQKLENKNVELEFQVLNYAKENAHLKTTYKNPFDSISVARTQTKTIIDSLQNKLQDTIYENDKLRAQLFDKVGEMHALSKPLTSNSIPTAQGSKVVKNVKVIALGMFRINPFKPSREQKHVPNKVRASVRTNPITISQPLVITKKVVNSNSNGLSSTGVDNTKTRKPQPRSNKKNDRVSSASKSSRSKNKEVEVEEHFRKLLLSRNKKHMSSECNNVKLATQNVKSKVNCAMCKKCLNSVNHDVCLINYVNGMTYLGKKQTANVSINEKQKKQQPKVQKIKKVVSIERLASPKPSKPRSFLKWSPTGRLFDLKGKIIASSESESQSDCSKGDNACTSNLLEPTIKRFPNFTFSLAGQFCDSDLEVAFRRNACFIRNLEGKLDLLFEAMYDDYIGGQPSSAPRTVLAAQAHQVRQTLTTSTSIADTTPTPTNSSSQATNFPNTSQDVDGLNSQ
nr:hypothetical protein [Tanacetum cinerariifolium]